MQYDVVIGSAHDSTRLKTCIRAILAAKAQVPADDVQIITYLTSELGTRKLGHWLSEEFGIRQTAHPSSKDCVGVVNTGVPLTAFQTWNRALFGMAGDAVLCLTDSAILAPGALLAAALMMQEAYPSFDGVVELLSGSRTAGPVFFIGMLFASRFSNRWAYCPHYFSQFADRELRISAQRWGVHTAVRGKVRDCPLPPTVSVRDEALFAQRQFQDIVWGATESPVLEAALQ